MSPQCDRRLRVARRSGLLAVVLLWTALGGASAQAAISSPPLRLNTGVGVPYTQEDGSGFLDRVVGEVFRRIGHAAVVVRQPSSARALINSNGGLDDGEALRVAGLEAQYPNLVRIEEKILDNDFVAYSREISLPLTGPETLKPYQIAYIGGWKVFDARFAEGYSVTLAQDADQLFTLLENGRTDVVLFERWQGDHLLARRGIVARRLSPPIVSSEMFMYLHRKHADLVQPAARALRAMKADGTYRRLLQETLLRSRR